MTSNNKNTIAESDYVGIIISATNSSIQNIKINNISKSVTATKHKDITYILLDGKANDVISLSSSSNYIYLCILCK